jgi:signal transduction histidine kinase
MADGGGAEAREIAVALGLIAPAVLLVPALGLSWVIAGRVRASVDQANSRITNAEAERQTRLQEVVHELRTPLAIMGTNLELALGDIDHGDAPYIEAARRAVDRMARTVDDLAGHGQLAVAPGGGPLDLAGCAREVVSEHLGPARERGVDVVAVGSRPLLVANADDGAVKGVLGNLLANAIRMAPKGSKISVDWGVHRGWAWIAVSDDGPGLAPHFHARAFERGWQGQHDRDRGGAGGLGLTIARQLAEAQGGEVVVDSDEGDGATFSLWLPALPDAERLEVIAADGVHPLVRPWRTGAAMVSGSF